VLIGCITVSKEDGSQVLDLQKDAKIAKAIKASHLYDHMLVAN
jgi:hypothetical protein